jgi:hypothetical protein
MVEPTQVTTTSYALTAEGSDIAARGSHEYRVWEVLPAKGAEGMSVPDLKVCLLTLWPAQNSELGSEIGPETRIVQELI